MKRIAITIALFALMVAPVASAQMMGSGSPPEHR